ncbi:uncharacterized protein LOC117106752 [Anneissia japonica]|uniref:uncharacterized protein LOC117106752 n=1 Tax=Anneissia japonica TaxID=1529436 RepID=UPI0014258B0A|nr:uncharacterized protein LOC117106752 [Anneissia japonica]
MTELNANHSSMDVSLVMDSERELRSWTVQIRKLVYISFGLLTMISIAVLVLCVMVGSYKSRIDHLTRMEEQIMKMPCSNGSNPITLKPDKVPKLQMMFTVYTRWGSMECPDTAQRLYKGAMAGAPMGKTGGGSNYLCLPDNPTYNFTIKTNENTRSYIAGTEYRLGSQKFTPYKALHTHNVPCAVCQAPRSVTLMMPADTKCPSGWTNEYDGYLWSSMHTHKRNEYVCVDSNPVVIPGTKTVAPDNEVNLLYLVESKCSSTGGGGLPCLPYENNWELSCAVCTR